MTFLALLVCDLLTFFCFCVLFLEQNPYVLCRLFHKPSDSCDAANCEEIENVNSTPTTTTTRCSPDDTSSEMVQETASSSVHALNRSDDTEKCSSDMGNDVKPDVSLVNNTSVNHAETLRARDRVLGKTVVEVIIC